MTLIRAPDCVIDFSMGKEKDAVSATQEEIIEEMAKALGHSGYLLETILERLAALDKRMEDAADDERYNALAEEFNALRNQALFRREMLVIHREAIGARKHRDIDIHYPIPDKKKKRYAHGKG